MNPIDEYIALETRRQFFGRAANGIGAAVLATLLGNETASATEGGILRQPHLAPVAKRVIDLFMAGAPLQIDTFDHDPAITYIQTGNQIPGRPSMGAWLSYGLGSLSGNLPSFVALNSKWSAKREAQALYSRLWLSGFLPSKHQGVAMRSQGGPVLYLSNPEGVDGAVRRMMLDGQRKLNEKHFEAVGDPEIQARIAQYERAFRMQSSVPELTDMSGESRATLEMYGDEVKTPGTFAYNCLMARRLAERGVRYTQIFIRGWDHHQALPRDLPLQCKDVDQGGWALVQDLKQRGMLDDTLVVWGGEFGRTIYCQGGLSKENYGRDHHPRCFTVWLAGGGVRPGITYGKTDDFSYNIVENPVHIRDFSATILHQLGIDHERLIFKHQGLDHRLTGVEPARVVKEILV